MFCSKFWQVPWLYCLVTQKKNIQNTINATPKNYYYNQKTQVNSLWTTCTLHRPFFGLFSHTNRIRKQNCSRAKEPKIANVTTQHVMNVRQDYKLLWHVQIVKHVSPITSPVKTSELTAREMRAATQTRHSQSGLFLLWYICWVVRNASLGNFVFRVDVWPSSDHKKISRFRSSNADAF